MGTKTHILSYSDDDGWVMFVSSGRRGGAVVASTVSPAVMEHYLCLLGDPDLPDEGDGHIGWVLTQEQAMELSIANSVL